MLDAQVLLHLREALEGQPDWLERDFDVAATERGAVAGWWRDRELLCCPLESKVNQLRHRV